MGYGNWLHGEAVAAGMVMAAEHSCLLGWLSTEDVEFVRDLLKSANLPIAPPDKMTQEDFMRYMSVDKKVENGTLRLILLKSLGEAVLTADFDPAALAKVLARDI